MRAAHSRANRRGRRPRRPAKPCANGHPRVTTRGDSRCRQHPRRGQDPSLRTEPLTGAHANPRAGHARPLPCGGPGTGVRVNPAATSRRRQQQPLPSPLGEGGPAGPDEGQAPAATRSRASRRGRRPRRPAKPCADGHPPDSHPRRGQDPSLRAEPLTGAHANPRAGHARPLPGDNPTHLYTT